EYLRSEEEGHPLAREQLLAEHPEMADDLRSFFHNRDAIERLARPLRGGETLASEEPTSVPPGTLVRYFGDYEIQEEIARGGMGIVYRARQVSLNRIVALKMILRGELATADDVQRFRHEAEAAANLDHPNIVPIYEVGEHEGRHYFTMKFIDGGNLASQVERFRDDPLAAARLLATCPVAVPYGHRRGIPPPDLDPA